MPAAIFTGYGDADGLTVSLIADCGHPHWPGWQIIMALVLAATIAATFATTSSPLLRPAPFRANPTRTTSRPLPTRSTPYRLAGRSAPHRTNTRKD